MPFDLLHIDGSSQQWCQSWIGLWFLNTVDTLVSQIANTRGKAKAQQMGHAKNLVGIYVDKSRICLHKTGYVAHISSRKCLHNPIAPGIRIMFVNGQVRLMIEQSIHHMWRITDGRTNHFDFEGAVLIREMRVKCDTRLRSIPQIDVCCGFWSSSRFEALSIR